MRRMVLRATSSKLTRAPVVISPASTTRLSLTRVSAATLERLSCARMASRIASDIWSATLSGWPSETDSEVKRKLLMFGAVPGRQKRAQRITHAVEPATHSAPVFLGDRAAVRTPPPSHHRSLQPPENAGGGAADAARTYPRGHEERAARSVRAAGHAQSAAQGRGDRHPARSGAGHRRGRVDRVLRQARGHYDGSDSVRAKTPAPGAVRPC